MDLVQQIVANLAVEEGQAEKGVGAILMALRMSTDKDTFEKAKVAVPNHESYMGRALMSGARTGEMVAMVGPGALMAGLAAAGFRKDDVPRLGRIVLEYLRPSIGNEAVERFLAGAPGAEGLASAPRAPSSAPAPETADPPAGDRGSGSP